MVLGASAVNGLTFIIYNNVQVHNNTSNTTTLYSFPTGMPLIQNFLSWHFFGDKAKKCQLCKKSTDAEPLCYMNNYL